jgi:subtilisin family serine protease
MKSVKIIKTLLMTVALPILAGAATHRYTVELSTEPTVRYVSRSFGANKASLARPEAQIHGDKIRAEQDTVAQKVRALGGTVVGQTDTASNTLTIELPEEKAASLASIPGVKGYHVGRTYRAKLDQATLVHKLPQAYGQIAGGASSAGAGVKIAIIDTGIDITSPAFKDTNFQMPAGFPKVNAASDTKYTNNKVIVARAYPNLWANTDPDPSASDESGHGTLTSSCAAAGPMTADVNTFFQQTSLTPPTLQGVAPGAWLGSYKVFGTPGVNDGATEAAILKAIDDAVKDGMDVINYSLGSFPPVPASLDMITAALNNAFSGGIIVTASAGNDGNGDDPSNPIDWVSADGQAIVAPALASTEGAGNVIEVGASSNGRGFGPLLTVGTTQYMVDSENALNYDRNGYLTFKGAPIVDVSTIDMTGQACSALPAGSLTGAIALMTLEGYDLNAGTCDPDTKMDNALAAGAVAGIIYDDFPESLYDINAIYTGFYGIDLLNATNLPGGFITWEDGVALKNQLAAQSGATASVDFSFNPVSLNSSRVAFLSSRGPNADYEIKPDLVAVGQDLLLPTETLNSGGDFYDASGVFYPANGTSASSPLVAGAAALLKSARPGLTALQYRSLLVNSTATIGDPINGGNARVMDTGSGLMDVNAAMNAEATVSPASVSFGVGDGSSTVKKTITVTNSGTSSDTFAISATPRDPGFMPQLSTNSLQLAPGASGTVDITIPGGVLTAGEYEGAIHIQGNNTATDTHVMYWFGVPSSTPYLMTDFGFDLVSFFNRGQLNKAAIAFRVTDASGITMTNVLPQVQVTYLGTYNQSNQQKVTGNAKVSAPYVLTDMTSPSYTPGVIAADVTCSSARNVYDLFEATVGDPNNPTVSMQFAIFGQ